MSILTIVLVFLAALAVTLISGLAWGFIAVYLPALLMLNQLPEFPIPHAPLYAHWAALYGILLALPFRRESLRLRWCTVDTIMVLLLVSVSITAWTTEMFETAVNICRTDLLQWIVPYFLARVVFRNAEYRRRTVYTMIACVGLMSVAALIEFRLTPYWYLHLLRDTLGMGNHIAVEAYSRFGFFRVAGTVDHPIYFGNMCVVLFGLIAVLARTSGLRLTNIWVALGLFGAMGCVVTSISFTPYMGLIAGALFFLTLVTVPKTRMLLVPGVLLAIGTATFITYHVAQQPLGERPEGELEGSMFIRRMIVIQSWKKAVEAGPFGFGLRYDFSHDTTDDEKFDLASIDNSYMQFTMTRGWVYTGLWLSIAVFFAGRMTIAFARLKHPSQVFPLAVCTATVLGLMVSMYTVWAGGIYTVFWLLMLALANTLIDLVLYPELREFGAQAAGAIPTVRSGMPAMAPPMRPAHAYPHGGQVAALGGPGAAPMRRPV